MERKIETLEQLFATFGYKTKDTPRAIWREVFGENLPDLSTKVTPDMLTKVCNFLSVQKKGRSQQTIETARALLNGSAPVEPKQAAVKTSAVPVFSVSTPKEPKPEKQIVQAIQDQKEEPTEKAPGIDWKHLLFSWLCVSFVSGHAILIWYDCIALWPGKMKIGPGMIGGGMAFIFQMAALVSAFDDTRGRTSSYALFFILLVDIAAGFLHYPTFIQGSEVGALVTGVFCGFVCLLSFASLALLRDSKIF